jgi:hypothetical protein
VAKDRAAPFSKKHRRYWIPVMGGMILIGLVNVALGLFSYTPPGETQRIDLDLPGRPKGTLGPGDLPAAVMRAFNARYPRTIPPSAVRTPDDRFVIAFPAGSPHHHATFTGDGTFVGED